ncbi:MAG: YeeE/YedE family protein, partial [Rhodospirillaceae bacterium]|nr:YeeE/YedE family protein [Rhodospirillaceae bacterium]
GSFLGAWLGKDLKLEGFKDGYSMGRYIIGAILMGFGAMLAGGCAVGAGLTGGAIFALTAWLALIGMWLGAGITDRLVDHAHPARFQSALVHRFFYCYGGVYGQASRNHAAHQAILASAGRRHCTGAGITTDLCVDRAWFGCDGRDHPADRLSGMAGAAGRHPC